MEHEQIGLAEAAARLRLPYQDAYRLMLMGQLDGQKSRGRWLVTSTSLGRVLSDRASAATK